MTAAGATDTAHLHKKSRSNTGKVNSCDDPQGTVVKYTTRPITTKGRKHGKRD